MYVLFGLSALFLEQKPSRGEENGRAREKGFEGKGRVGVESFRGETSDVICTSSAL